MVTKPDTTALVKFDPAQYPALVMDEKRARKLQRLVGGLTQRDLSRIVCNIDGDLSLPDETRPTGKRKVNAGETLPLVILATNMAYRSVFDGVYDPASPKPPLCWSHTSQVGEGAFKGRECVTCPLFNTYSDAEKRTGGCWNHPQVAALVPGQKLPVIMQIPLTGAKTFRKYLVQVGLDERDLELWHMVTLLTVEKDGRAVRFVGTMGDLLPAEIAARLEEQASVMDTMINTPQAGPIEQPTPYDDDDSIPARAGGPMMDDEDL